MADLNMLNMFSLIRQRDYSPVYLNQTELGRYIDIFFLETSYDWTKFPEGEYEKKTRYEATQCT